MAHLDRAATKELDAAGIDPLLRELVRVRASQLNGCAYCVDMHTKDARAAGETEQRLYALPAWRETPFFTNRERAALALTEDVTLMARDHVPDAAYEAAAEELTPGEIAALLVPDHHDQRLERDRRDHPRLDAGLLPALTPAPGRRPHAASPPSAMSCIAWSAPPFPAPAGSGAPPIIRSIGRPPVRANRTTRTAARTRKTMLSQVV